MKTILLKSTAFIIKTFGLIIGIPGMVLSFIGLYLADVADSIIMYADDVKNKIKH